MNEFLKFFFLNATYGFALGVVCSVLIVYFDIANIGSLVLRSDVGLLAFGLMTFKLGLTFGAAQVGIAVFTGAGGDRRER